MADILLCEPPPPAPASKAGAARTTTILVADDDPTFRLLARVALEEAGFAVEEAADGAAAVDVFDRVHPDLAVLDVNMPALSGFDVCAHVRATPAGCNTPILILTSADDTASIHRAYEAGATDFLTKPVNWTLLGYRVRYALRDTARVLLEVSRTVGATLDLAEVMRRLTREVVRALHADMGGAWTMTAEGLRPIAAYRAPEGFALLAPSAFSDQVIAGAVRRLQGPVFSGDSRHDPRFQHPLFRAIGHRSLLVLPLWVNDRLAGGLVIAWTRARYHITAEELQLAEAIARHSTVAIVNARLHADVRLRDEQLRQSQKMEAVGRLSGGIAHDFNNLLTVVCGSSQLLLTRVSPGTLEHRQLTTICEVAGRGAKLTRQLLAFARRHPMAPTRLEPNEHIDNARPLLEPLLGRGIELVTELDPRAGALVADPTHLDQVIMNLVINARDAMPDGGRLTITTARVDVDAERAEGHAGVKPGRYVSIAVRDTGTGMDGAVRARLFEPFFTTKEAGKGTGLGLATVYGIVTQNGGFVVVDSEPGRGSTFTIHLPSAEPAD